MEIFKSLLVEVWQELSRQIGLTESLDKVRSILEKQLPLQSIIVCQFDPQQRGIHTIALSGPRQNREWGPARTGLSREEVERLMTWWGKKKLVHAPATVIKAQYPWFLPYDIEGDVLAGPLSQDAEPLGALLLEALPGRHFQKIHLEMARALLDPFSCALQNSRQFRELQQLREAAEADRSALLSKLERQDVSDSIIGAEAGLRTVMERVGQVAASDVPVLVLGETGSGKEVVARALHQLSRYRKGPFFRVNCGAIPPELIDSELFGHERGSFTGAVSTKKGWFERADGGTLFLDEAGELPSAAQVRLLRVLQDGTFERIGGQRQISVDVRVVAATNRNLEKMVADGLFREDLWYRLAVFIIRLPALRERLEDIPQLASHFALRAARRLGAPSLAPTAEDIRDLVAYNWPGNVRELSSVIDRAVILGNGQRLEIQKALGVSTLNLPAGEGQEGKGEADRQPVEASKSIEPLDTIVRHHIERALVLTHGRIEGRYGAANHLRINPHTLRARMRKLGIDWKRFKNPD